MKILIIPNFSKPGTREILKRVSNIFDNLGVKTIVNHDTGSDNFSIDNSVLTSADILLVIGGDGTILHSAKQAARANVPVLGINSGTLGFMAGLEPNNLEELSRLINGNYVLENRIMLDINVMINGQNMNFTALNEAVVTRSAMSKIIDIDLRLDNNKFDNYRADGIMISTPTGSTAYALSAGGPILDPSIECMTITPVCPHSLVARSIVLSTQSRVEVIATQSDENSEILLIVDGSEHIIIPSKSLVTISKSREIVKLIKLREESFYQKIKDKFLSF